MAQLALPTAIPVTLDEWGALPTDAPGEWADGFVVEDEMADFTHEVVVVWLIRLLANWVETKGGWVFGSEAKFAVSVARGRKPDVTVFLPGSPLPPRHGVARVPPDIAIEVVSLRPSDQRRDRIDKHDEYAAFGVKHYWLVDPEARLVQMFELRSDGRYLLAAHAADGPLVAPGVEDLTLDLDALWAKLDRLPTGD